MQSVLQLRATALMCSTLVTASALLVACGGGGSSATAAASVFPSGLALASPSDMQSGSVTLASRSASPFDIFREAVLALYRGDRDTAALAFGKLLPLSNAWAATRSPGYIVAANRINSLLTGATPARTAAFFNATRFLASVTNAGCYGPSILYQDHPDGATPNSGTLPSGDLGMWTVTDSSTGHVCASAQLDARMDGISQRTNTGLMTLVSLINVASTAGKALPAAGSSLSLISEMNTAFSASGLTFTTATVAQSSTSVWTYTVQFSFTDASSLSHNAEIKLTHTPGTDSTHYSGLLTYAVTRGIVNMLNCPGTSGGTVDVGTLKYTRSGRTSANLVHREGNYCGAGTPSSLATSVADFSSDGQLDPAGKWTGTRGWANNFNRFGANYDPTTSQGYYALGWQAGYNDGNSRVFNIGLNYNAVTEVRDGESYFGYGSDIATSTGAIQGFICNWAGPGNSHTLQDYFQRQFVAFNDTSGKWEAGAGGAASSSNITYAPTNSCAYAGGGTFIYDKNANASLADDTVGAATVLDLKNKTFGATTYATIPLAIAGRGMVVPSF
jgi:hypothetical protein